jgi:hydrogenase maturation protease
LGFFFEAAKNISRFFEVFYAPYINIGISMTSKATAIMGFGNPCRSDDAVGIYVIDQLKKFIGDAPGISIFDMGTGAFEVLFKLKGHQKIIMVDAVLNTGEQPGTLYKVPAHEVMTAPQEDPMVFLHSIKWDQALSYAKKILQNEYPNDIHVYLIAIENTKLDMELSDTVRQAGDKVVQLIIQEELSFVV